MSVKFDIRRPKSRILTSVVALLFVIGVIPLGLLGERMTYFNRERLEVQQQEVQLVIATGIADELEQFVEAKLARIQGFARGFEAALTISPERALAAVTDSALLNRYLEEDRDLVSLVLAVRSSGDDADPRHFTTVQARAGAAGGAVVEAEGLLVSTLLERALFGASALETSASAPPVLIAAVPVRRGAEIDGVLGAVVSLERVRARLAERSEERYLVYLSDRAGQRLLARSRADSRPHLLDSELAAAFRDAGGDPRTIPFEAEIDGDRHDMLGAFAPVVGTGWGVFVEVDAASAYYAVRKMRETTLVWSVVAVLLALIFGTLFARRLVHPIRELAAGALRLARGDFSRRIDIESTNEIGVLADGFNHMADEIREQMTALEAAARQNKELFLGTVRMLAEAIDEKDPYTRGHSERVTRYAVAIARSLDLDETQVERVQMGALLHDVGKIGIDDRILRKPAMLTDAEFAIMKQHPDKGAHIMGTVAELRHIVPAMRFHHEKIDGTGYPLGLSGDEIPLEAQIVSVADTFDAMTTHRPYQKAMDPEFVIEKLKGWVGTRFRPDVVDAFARAWRAGAVRIGDVSTDGIPEPRATAAPSS